MSKPVATPAKSRSAPPSPKALRAARPAARISRPVRSAVSTRRIIRATITCLNRFGYGGTTVDAVLKEANVSRGRLLHYFPTRVDLMIAVGEYVWRAERRYLRLWARQYPSIAERLPKSVDHAWRVKNRPTGIAVLAIFIACRSDQELAQRFLPVYRKIGQETDEIMATVIDDLKPARRQELLAFPQYLTAFIHGLAIDWIVSGRPAHEPPALQLVRNHVAYLVGPRGD